MPSRRDSETRGMLIATNMPSRRDSETRGISLLQICRPDGTRKHGACSLLQICRPDGFFKHPLRKKEGDFSEGKRADFEKVLLGKLPAILDEQQKKNKVKNNL